jgi:2-dehydro-3-deoxyphosphogluconate aldolase/(4S)-4-hydroxy-2-oxoglutarate aldolase
VPTKLNTLNRIVVEGALVIVRLDDADEAFRASAAAIDGGIRALGVIERLVEKYGDDVSIGAGTVIDGFSAYAAISAGASFVVSPQLNVEMIRTANRYQVAIVGGAYSPTEIVESIEAGVDIVKLFPAEIGPEYVRAVLAPLAHVPIMPAGGVTRDNVRDWFSAGVVAVGVGSAITKAARPDGDYARVSAAAGDFLQAVRDGRS